MTLLSVVNAAADAVSLSRFLSVYGSTNESEQMMVEFAKVGGEEIARRVDWQRMLRTATAAVSPMPLPADFQRVVAGGVRTVAGDYVRPVINGGQWATVLQVNSMQPYYFVSGGVVAFSPSTAGTLALVDYVSRYWVLSSDGTPKEAFSADDDAMVFPERLLVKDLTWRWKRQQGLPYDDILAEFEADLQQEINADRGAM